MKRSNVHSFYQSSFHPTCKKLRSRRLRKILRAVVDDDTKSAKDSSPGFIKYIDKIEHGHAVPKNWRDIIRINTTNGNHKWHQAVEKDVFSLLHLQYFDIWSPDFKPSEEYQYVRMKWVYAVKNDFVYKDRLVCDGSRVDPKGLDTRATVVKSISVHLLDLIAHAWHKQVMTGDIGNAFVQSDTQEKIYT